MYYPPVWNPTLLHHRSHPVTVAGSRGFLGLDGDMSISTFYVANSPEISDSHIGEGGGGAGTAAAAGSVMFEAAWAAAAGTKAAAWAAEQQSPGSISSSSAATICVPRAVPLERQAASEWAQREKHGTLRPLHRLVTEVRGRVVPLGRALL